MKRTRIGLAVTTAVAAGLSLAVVQACGSGKSGSTGFTFDSGGGNDGTAPTDGPSPSDGGMGGDTTSCIVCGDSGPPPDTGPIPKTCAESVTRNSYIGCDYWPTVTLNPVWPMFDYAVAVSNPQTSAVTVTVTADDCGFDTATA